MITIVGWLWRDPNCRTRYTVEHANTWARMLHRNLTIAHRFVVFTDRMSDRFDPLIEARPLWDDYHLLGNSYWRGNVPQCYVRLKAFSRDPAIMNILGPRYASIDFDCVVLRNMDDLLTRKEPFVIWRRPAMKQEDKLEPYNASMWLMDTGSKPEIWEDFKGERSIINMPQEPRFLLTDQGWMLYKLGMKQPNWTKEDGVYMWSWLQHKGFDPPADCKIIFFNGNLKPWSYDWIREVYR